MQVTEELNIAKEQVANLQASSSSSSREGLGDGESVLAELDRARQEIAGLRYLQPPPFLAWKMNACSSSCPDILKFGSASF